MSEEYTSFDDFMVGFDDLPEVDDEDDDFFTLQNEQLGEKEKLVETRKCRTEDVNLQMQDCFQIDSAVGKQSKPYDDIKGVGCLRMKFKDIG